MPKQPDQKKHHLDSTNLGSERATTQAEKLKALGLSDIPQAKAIVECQEAMSKLSEVILAWLVYLYCWNGKRLHLMTSMHLMTSDRYNSIVEKLGTRTAKALASIEPHDKAVQELKQAMAKVEAELAERKKSEPSAEPPKKISLEENPLLVPPRLAGEIGLHESIILQQIHYWLHKGAGKLIDGSRWIWNTLDDWLKQFPGISKWQLRKALCRLRDELGLVEFSQQKKEQWDRTGWYTINYQRLKALWLSMCGPPHIDVCPPTDRCVTVHTSSGTETTPEISSKRTVTPAAAILNSGGEEVDKATQVNSLLDQEERELTSVVSKISDQGDFSGATSDSVEKMNLVEDAEISLTPQLRRTLENYDLEQVAAAVDHYRSVSRAGRRKNPAGWLTDCLKGQWWVGTETATEMTHPASKVYTAADFEVVEKSPVPKSFKDMIAQMARNRNFAN